MASKHLEANKIHNKQSQQDSTEKQDDDVKKDGGCHVQMRYLVVFSVFLLNTTFYIMRVNLSVAIVAIALSSNETETLQLSPRAPHYDWDSETRSLILSAFFWGYAALQIPGTWAVEKFGARLSVLAMIVISTVASFLFVPAAALGWGWVVADRVLLGFGQGALMPACHAIISRWSPPVERGRMTVYVYTGNMFGTVVALSGSGVISDSAGWPVVFYVSGGLGVLMCALWLLLGADSPEQHRLASEQEKLYITRAIGEAGGNQNKKLPIPWRAIFTSGPFLALVVVQCAHLWGFYTLLTAIPSYMNGVLAFNLSEDNAAQWRIVFMIAAGFYLVGNTLFVVFGSGKVQPWNSPAVDSQISIHCTPHRDQHKISIPRISISENDNIEDKKTEPQRY